MLRVTTFAGLLKGGDSGNAIQPGGGAKSLLVRKLKGTAGDRMPRGKPPLSDAVIAQFEKWINEGAHFDGHNANATMQRVADVYRVRTSTHEQLSRTGRKLQEHLAAGDPRRLRRQPRKPRTSSSSAT